MHIWAGSKWHSLLPVPGILLSASLALRRELLIVVVIVFDVVCFVPATRLFSVADLSTHLCFLHLWTASTNTIDSPQHHIIHCTRTPSSSSHLFLTDLQSMGLPKFSATTHFKMVSPSEHTKNVSTVTYDNMAALTINSNPSQRPPPTFGGLLTELKKLIVHHAEDSCLANLRLTNKELNAITTKPFCESLLVERRFMLSEYSLQGLVDLTVHPDFGK